MNIPFPVLYPQIIIPDWFHADEPYDEDAELTRLERENEQWLNSIGQQYMKHPATAKKLPRQEPAAEEAAGSDDDASEDAEESEESREVNEDDVPPTDSPSVNNEGESETPEDITEPADLEEEAASWPFVNPTNPNQ